MSWLNIDEFRTPDEADINLWADTIERICFFSKDKELNLEDSCDWIYDDYSTLNEKKKKDILSALNFNEQFIKNAIVEPDEQNGREELEEEDLFRDKLKGKISVVFNFLSSRANLFLDYYPFEIERKKIRVKKGQSDIHQVYIILLLSSNLRIFGNKLNQAGHLFEALCRYPFIKLLPESATVKFFGSGAGEIMKRDYEGNLLECIESLARDLDFQPNSDVYDPDELGSTGDAGLDWVAWVDFPYGQHKKPIYFAQCACGSNWLDKQDEASISTWRNYIQITSPIQTIHFVPRSFRRYKGEWVKRTSISEVVLIDRIRILYLVNNQPGPILNIYKDLLSEVNNFLLD